MLKIPILFRCKVAYLTCTNQAADHADQIMRPHSQRLLAQDDTHNIWDTTKVLTCTLGYFSNYLKRRKVKCDVLVVSSRLKLHTVVERLHRPTTPVA
jgi:acetone carboxylase gamma subunit